MDTSEVWDDLPANSRGRRMRAWSMGVYGSTKYAREHDAFEVVYVATKDGSKVKIGVASCPHARMAVLGTRLLFALPCANPYWVEQHVHRRLIKYAKGGEWFSCSAAHAKQEIEIAIRNCPPEQRACA